MDFFALETAEIYRLIGITGFAAYVMTYAALSFRWVSGDCITYFAGNTIAAVLVLISLVQDFNVASVLIQLFWITIGVVAIAARLRRGARGRSVPLSQDGTASRTRPATPNDAADGTLRPEPPLTRRRFNVASAA